MQLLYGTSAGGYTALMSLATHPDSIKQEELLGITDLHEMISNTYRLEAYYNESLIGKLPERKVTINEVSDKYCI
jgi:hypothetical protein